MRDFLLKVLLKVLFLIGMLLALASIAAIHFMIQYNIECSKDKEICIQDNQPEYICKHLCD